MTISVLVVDDSAFFRRRVTEILNDHPELNVIGSAADGREAVSETQRLKPDVITMDIEMPVLDGISAVREIIGEYTYANNYVLIFDTRWSQSHA